MRVWNQNGITLARITSGDDDATVVTLNGSDEILDWLAGWLTGLPEEEHATSGDVAVTPM